MLSLRSFAASTLGELKGALVEADDDEDDDEDVSPTPTPSGPPLGAAFPPAGPRAEHVPSAAAVVSSQAQDTVTALEVSAPAGTITASVAQAAVHQSSTASVPQVEVPQPSASGAPSPPAASIEAGHVHELASTTLSSSAPSCAVDQSDESLHMLAELVPSPVSDSHSEMSAHGTFSQVFSTPGLVNLLRENYDPVGSCVQGCNWDTDSVARMSISRVALESMEAVRVLAPHALAGAAASGAADTRRLLVSFTERYDSLLSQYNALQERFKTLEEKHSIDSLDLVRQAQEDVEAWQAAHRSATARVEELGLENGDLKERVRSLEKKGGGDPDQQRLLERKLAIRDAEISAANDAIRQLQEVMEEGSSSREERFVRLERELVSAKQSADFAMAARDAQVTSVQQALADARMAQEREAVAMARCQAAERESQESATALESLLSEKEHFLEERDHLVDARLVSTMLAQCSDHLSSGQTALADQVLVQTIQVFGGAQHVAERRKIRADALEAQRRQAGPLGDAFVEFLTRETGQDRIPDDPADS